jgi:putative hydrolase of HD superfamily
MLPYRFGDQKLLCLTLKNLEFQGSAIQYLQVTYDPCRSTAMENLVEFMELVSSLKELQRTGWKQHEVTGIIDTTASHSYGVVLLSWVFAKEIQVDLEKVLKMAAVHDLVESVIGDLTPTEAKRIDRDALEENGLRKIESELPNALLDEVKSLIREFRAGATKEAKTVRVCDKLETLFQAHFYRKSDRLSEHGFREFLRYAEKECRTRLAKEILSQIKNSDDKMN